jgi:hypothetical protein
MIFIHVRVGDENRVTYTVDNEKEALGYIISLAINQIKFMSVEAMKQWIIDACEFVLDVERSDRPESYEGDKALVRKINTLLEYLQTNEFTHERMMQTLVNIAMGGMGLGTLPGFRHSGIPSMYKINPELVSQYELHRKK